MIQPIKMEEEKSPPPTPEPPPAPAKEEDKGSSTATLEAPKTKPAKPKPRDMPKWRVLLHNDDVNDMFHVIKALVRTTPLSIAEAETRMLEAHRKGVALVLTTHKELAELYQEQLTSFSLTVTIEPET